MIEYLMETQRIRLPSLWKEASGNWRGETTCREYRREQLLTPTAHQSAVRLGKAKRTRLRMIRLYIGLTLQRRESSTLSTDAYLLAKCLHLVLFFFFCSIPEVKAGCLPSVLFEAQINQTDCPSHTIRRDLLVTLTCCKLLLLFFFFLSEPDQYYGFAVPEIHRKDQYHQFLSAPTWGQPPSWWTGCRRGKRSEDPSATPRWETSRPVPQKMPAGGWGRKKWVFSLLFACIKPQLCTFWTVILQTLSFRPQQASLKLSLLKDVEETFKSLVYILWQPQSSIIMLLLLVLQCFLKNIHLFHY